MKLSIITINYNNAAGLKKTLDSVASQTCSDFEHIIVDGASTDGSVEIIREYENTLVSRLSPLASRLKWLSEPDTGIYNAMNKGVRLAKGEYILMLNSGDYLLDDNVIANVTPILDGTDIIQGNTIEDIGDKHYRNRGYGKTDINFFDVMKGHFLHQATFCRRDLFDRYGMFDESYRIIGDTKFFMRCLGREDASFRYNDVDISNYDLTGISAETSGKWVERKIIEDARMRSELYSNRLNKFFEENDKKIRLYDKLHKHRWIWYIVMAIAHICNYIYAEDPIVYRERL
ncbi:MAG: glycosyltransferase [Paludibacteraceae bacterium]|nr:glycosyltransferase [Paludibacteraceae bacterium]MBO5829452.1 glycosyltransferase [Paludibacteraceae bacterium]